MPEASAPGIVLQKSTIAGLLSENFKLTLPFFTFFHFW